MVFLFAYLTNFSANVAKLEVILGRKKQGTKISYTFACNPSMQPTPRPTAVRAVGITFELVAWFAGTDHLYSAMKYSLSKRQNVTVFLHTLPFTVLHLQSLMERPPLRASVFHVSHTKSLHSLHTLYECFWQKNIIYRPIWSYGNLFLLMPKVGQNFSLVKKKWYQSYIPFNQPKEHGGGMEVGHPLLLLCYRQSRHRNLKKKKKRQ